MCTGSSKRKLCPPGFSMDPTLPKPTQPSILLELSASDDLPALKSAAEGGAALDEEALWYGRRMGARRMGFDDRTPLMIAASYGSVEVLKYLLGRDEVDVNRGAASDGATALHCAAAGAAPAAPEVVRLLLDAGARLDCVDGDGNRPADVVGAARVGKAKRRLETALSGGELEEEAVVEERQGSPERREYPADQSLPDIKTGIYGTDEFRMYSFKIKPCSRAYSHDWTECPFVHPGENARRRDPRKYHYSCVPCPEFRKGSCRNGDACEYAHGVFECWLHPAQYRTRLCKDETNCNRRVCFFAHKQEELRPLYASTGSAMPSPRSSAAAPGDLPPPMTPIALGSPSIMMLPTSTPPMSPSSSLALAAAWQNHSILPTLQLPSSRLKSTLSARELDLDLDDLAAFGAFSGPRPGKFPQRNTLSPSNLDDLFTSAVAGSSPMRTPTTSLGLDPSMSVAAAMMTSRSAAFAKRSQSFSERALSRLPASAAAASPLSDWGSPDGKLEWGIQGEELQKFRKSASFALRGGGIVGGAAMRPPSTLAAVDEPDFSWVNSLVKDGPPGLGNWPEPDFLGQKRRGAADFHGGEMLPPWTEQPYMEQEQLVA